MHPEWLPGTRLMCLRGKVEPVFCRLPLWTLAAMGTRRSGLWTFRLLDPRAVTTSNRLLPQVISLTPALLRRRRVARAAGIPTRKAPD